MDRRLVESIAKRMQDDGFKDTATFISNNTESYDDYGYPVVNEVTSSVSCSFTDKASQETWGELLDTLNIDAEIRVIDVVPTNGWKVKLTAHFGDSSYVDETFEIVGIKQRTPFGYVCALKRVSV